MVDDAEATFRSPATLYQDFIVRCRIRGLAEAPLDLSVFRRRLMIARAGMSEDISEDPEWRDAMEIGHSLPEDMLGVFLLIARAAKAGTTCPTDEEVARVYGTHSVGRVRRLLGYMEAKGTFVPRIDLVGRRTISIPRLGWTTAPSGSDTRAGALHRREMPASHKQENAS
jgi:hypothetical protein